MSIVYINILNETYGWAFVASDPIQEISAHCSVLMTANKADFKELAESESVNQEM
jgi:hypothetical protein